MLQKEEADLVRKIAPKGSTETINVDGQSWPRATPANLSGRPALPVCTVIQAFWREPFP